MSKPQGDAKIRTTRDALVPGKRRGALAEQRLHEAYANVFSRGGEDVDLVLADLAEYSGYFFVTPTGTSADDLFRVEGSRQVFARILSLISLPMSQLEALRKAALEELQTSNEEGSR